MILLAMGFWFLVGCISGAILIHNDYKESAEAGKIVVCGGKAYRMVEVKE